MSEQLRAAALLRQAAAILDTTPASSVEPAGRSQTSTSTVSNSISTVSTAARSLFGPYRGNHVRPSIRSRRGRIEPAAPVSYWSHRFSIVPRCAQETVPSREEKFKLHNAGLGEKKLTFVKNSVAGEFENTLENAYPKLKNCGGYELLRTIPGSRVSLEVMRTPTEGFSSAYLSDESNLGQALCYIRPIQKDLDLGVLNSEPSEACKECLQCGQMIAINLLRDHVITCQENDNDSDSPPGKIRRSIQTPVCQFACVAGSSENQSTEKNNCTCPVCGIPLPPDEIEVHADICCENAKPEEPSVKVIKRSLRSELDSISSNLSNSKKGCWLINVVRKHLIKTVLEELTDADASDWDKPIKVNFVGEEGCDAGGLTREFYSLIFKLWDIFENGSLKVDCGLLEKKMYVLLGRLTARAIISGHPGPRCFNALLAHFICTGEEPDLGSIPDEYIGRCDVLTAINEICSNSPDFVNLATVHSDLLQQAGFRKVLSPLTAPEATHALRRQFSFYHVVGPLLQFREGLKLLGVQTILQNHPESVQYFTNTCSSATAEEVQSFFKPTYTSTDEGLKNREEMIVYNFGKFLKKAERGRITTPWINLDDGEETEVVITTKHVLQALLGCDNLPRNIECGLIEFDHESINRTTINTCAPSITFSQTTRIEEYDTFETHLLSVIVDAYGFGIE